MNTFSLLFQVVIAFVAVNCQQYVQQPLSGPCPCSGQFDQHILDSQSNSAAQAQAQASANAASSNQNSLLSNNGQLITGPGGMSMVGLSGPMGGPLAGPNGYSSSAGQYNYAAVDPKAQNTQVSASYHSNKGEILIHRPAPIIVKRPPTKVLVNHPPIVVKPAPVVLHKPPPVIMRKVFVKQHPRPVKVEPVYVNVVKPPAEKYFVNEKASQGAAGSGYNQFQQGQTIVQGPAQFQGQSQLLGSGQLQGQLQLQGLGQLQGPAQYNMGAVQFPTGPAQYSFNQGQSQSQSNAQAQASAHAESDSHNYQSDASQLQYNQIQPHGY